MTPDNLAFLVLGLVLLWGSGFAVGWHAGRAVTRYMLGGKL